MVDEVLALFARHASMIIEEAEADSPTYNCPPVGACFFLMLRGFKLGVFIRRAVMIFAFTV